MSNDKPTNPKDLIGSSKLPLHLWPQTATAMGSLALLEGALKYGRNNYRAIGVRATIYYDALQRHITSWFEGQDVDPESGLPHLAHALACLAILVDAQACGKLNDDRQYPGGWLALKERLTPDVDRLKTKYQDRSPQHYTIQELAHHAWNHPQSVDREALQRALVQMGLDLDAMNTRPQLREDLSHEDAEGDPEYWGV